MLELLRNRGFVAGFVAVPVADKYGGWYGQKQQGRGYTPGPSFFSVLPSWLPLVVPVAGRQAGRRSGYSFDPGSPAGREESSQPGPAGDQGRAVLPDPAAV